MVKLNRAIPSKPPRISPTGVQINQPTQARKATTVQVPGATNPSLLENLKIPKANRRDRADEVSDPNSPLYDPDDPEYDPSLDPSGGEG